MTDGRYHQTNDSSLTARSFCDSHIGQHQVHILVPLPLWSAVSTPCFTFTIWLFPGLFGLLSKSSYFQCSCSLVRVN